jgi:signal transduction histidine kinase
MKLIRLYSRGLFLLLLPFHGAAQNNPFWQEPTRIQVDSLKGVLAATKNDTVNMYINRQLGMYYQEINRPVALAYYESMLMQAKKTNQQIWEAEALSRIGYVSCLMQNYSGGLKSLLLAKTIASEPGAEQGIWGPGLLSKKSDAYEVRLTVLADINQHCGIAHFFTGDFSKALDYYRKVNKINEILNDYALKSTAYSNMGECYLGLNQLDSAEFAFNESIHYADKSGRKKYKGLTYWNMGKVYEVRNNLEKAKMYYRLGIETSIEVESPDFEGMSYQAIADMSQNAGNVDSVFFFSRKALNTYLVINDTLGLIAAFSSLSYAFDASDQTDSAYYYLKKSIALKDALNKEGRIKSFQLTGFNEQFKLQELEAEQLRVKTKMRTYSFIAGTTVLLLISVIFYRNYRRQRKDKTIIENAYGDLKSTQAQLIQSEKMASLGELTAGIAHEIQNPLNFVNNFSEVSREIIEELKNDREKLSAAEQNEIFNDLDSNLEKITVHGKRADAIVKGMLQHSRTSSGQKELTDINALCDEYMRLSFHGLRAKDKSFNAKFETDLDRSIPRMMVAPQEMGRVILNLINNAFYSVNQRKQNKEPAYEPTVTVSTKKIRDEVEIIVRDNGMGIPQKVVDKIFQPFFTTKPTGQGTGLGLSLSYDIITKEHGGTLRVETKEGSGASIIIHIPLATSEDKKNK